MDKTIKGCLILCVIAIISAQYVLGTSQIQILWEKTIYEEFDFGKVNFIEKTSDNNLQIIAELTYHEPTRYEKYVILEIDSNGELISNKSLGGIFQKIVVHQSDKTEDGFIATASTFPSKPSEFFLIKTDSEGNHKWNKTFEIQSIDAFTSEVIQTSDKGFLVYGWMEYGSKYNTGSFIIKTDSEGDLEWNKTYKDYEFDWISFFYETSDNKYIYGGDIITINNKSFSWLRKVDKNGTEEWYKEYKDMPYNISFLNLIEVENKGFLIGAQTLVGELLNKKSDIVIIKTGSQGEIEWQNKFGGDGKDIPHSVIRTPDLGYLIVAETTSFSTEGLKTWIIKTDSEGNHKWNRTFGESGHYNAYFAEIIDNEYLIVATAWSPEKTDKEKIWLLKLKEEKIISPKLLIIISVIFLIIIIFFLILLKKYKKGSKIQKKYN